MPNFNVSGSGSSDDLNRLLNEASGQGMSANPEPSSSLDDLAYNEKFPSRNPSSRRFPDRSGNISGKGDKGDLQYAAIESLVSQVISRAFGTSFYPVVTALRLGRTAAKEQLGDDVNIADIIKFTIDSTEKYFGSMFKFGSKGADTGAEDAVERFTNATNQAASNTEELDNGLNDLAENQILGGGGGGRNRPPGVGGLGGQPGGNPPGANGLTSMEQLAASAGAAASYAFVAYVAKDFITDLGRTISDTISRTNEIAVKAIANAQSVSPIEAVGIGPRAIAGGTKAGSGVAGAVGGRLAKPLVTGLIGKVAGSLSATIGGALGSAAPIIGTVVGFYIGKTIGKVIDKAVNAVVDQLVAIDESIMQVAISLTPYSGELSATQAESSLRFLQSDINRAQEMGPMLASYMESRTDFALELQKLGDTMTQIFTPIMGVITDVGTNVLSVVNTVADFQASIGSTINNSIFEFVQENIPYLGPALKAMQTASEITSRNDQSNLFTEIDQFLNPATNPTSLSGNPNEVDAFAIPLEDGVQP